MIRNQDRAIDGDRAEIDGSTDRKRIGRASRLCLRLGVELDRPIPKPLVRALAGAAALLGLAEVVMALWPG